MTIAVIDAATVGGLICDFPAADPYRSVIEAATAVAVPADLAAEPDSTDRTDRGLDLYCPEPILNFVVWDVRLLAEVEQWLLALDDNSYDQVAAAIDAGTAARDENQADCRH